MKNTTDSTLEVVENQSQVSPLLERAIRDIGIPPCPAILSKINTEMRKDEPNFKHLTSIINADVGISAGLITIANSPFFGVKNRIRNVNEALMILGLPVASRAIAGILLQKLFPRTPRLDRFWHSSACIARLSGWLAPQVLNSRKIRADDAYTFGLFRDCGIPMLMNRFPQYTEVLKKANEEREQSFTEVEDSLCSVNHAVIGGFLAQSWWLPEDICLAIRHHHEYPAVGSKGSTVLSLVAISQLSEHLLQRNSGLSATMEWEKSNGFCLDQLGLDPESLSQLYEASSDVIADQNRIHS